MEGKKNCSMDIQIELDALHEQGRVFNDAVLNLNQLIQKMKEKRDQLMVQLLDKRKHQEAPANRDSVMKEAEYKIIQKDIELSISEIEQHIDFLEKEMRRLSKMKEVVEKEAQECKHSEKDVKRSLVSANHSFEAERRLFDMHIHLMQQSNESQLQEITVSYTY